MKRPGARGVPGRSAAPWGAGSASGGAGAAGGGRGRGIGACAVRPGGAGTRRTRGEGGAARAGRSRAGPKREGAGPGRARPRREAAGRRPGVSGRAGPRAEERWARRPGRGAMAAAETKIIYHLDEQETPYLVKLPIPAERVTLGDFKGLLNRPNYKFYFKSMDDDFG